MGNLIGFSAAGLLAVFLLAPATQASAPDGPPAQVPATLLESFPDRSDLSLDQVLRIYALYAGRALQVNDSKGTILGAYLTSGYNAQPLPLGEKPQIMSVLAPSAEGFSSFDAGPMPTPCPCRSSLAHQDAQMRIVAIFDKDGSPVQLVQVSQQTAHN